jgi:AraC-like DNA-binding protein
MRYISFDEIHPFIRYAHFFIAESGSPFVGVMAYDCRLMYISGGEGHLMVDGNEYEAAKGTLFLWNPGVVYSLCPSPGEKLHIIGVNFDYSLSKNNITYPIVPDKEEVFVQDNIVDPIEFSDLVALNKPVCIRNMLHLENLLLDLTNEYQTRKFFFSQKARGHLLYILGEIGRCVSTSSDSKTTAWHQKVDHVIQYIHDHYCESLSNRDIAQVFNYHPVHINRMMVRYTGFSLHQYLINYRITEAINMMQTNRLSITDIAYAVGFANVGHFTKYFRKVTGMNPRKYISSHGSMSNVKP